MTGTGSEILLETGTATATESATETGTEIGTKIGKTVTEVAIGTETEIENGDLEEMTVMIVMAGTGAAVVGAARTRAEVSSFR